MNQNSYKEFPNFVLRSPILPLNFFLDLTSGIEVTDKRLKKAFESPIIQEAVFLASPSLFEEVIKWLNGDFESTKIKFALLKYLARMSFRCTPFGLFAGCSVGQISNITRIQIGKPFEHERHTRLDMNYLVALAKDLSKQTIIREHLLFYKNSSAYTIADELRYVEYQYFNNKRLHQIVSVECTDYLLRIIEKAKNGCSLNDLRKELEIENVDNEEINEFIDELIDSQVLISELEPSVSGPEGSVN